MYRKGLSDLPTYDVTEKEWEIKLNANESSLNLPPLVEERVMNRLSHIAFHRYPDTELTDLKELIAANFRLSPDNVLIGNGSSEILEKLFFAFGGPGRTVVFPMPSFSMYHIYAKLSESEAKVVPLCADYSLDVKQFVQTVQDSDAKLAVLCTPNNPTGNVVSIEDLAYIAKNIDCPFAVDEAYVEFYGVSAAGLLEKYPNLIVARTFSKAYGMAAVRVGYMLAGRDIAAMVGKAFMPYHVNVLTLAAAAIVYQMRDEFVPRIQMYVAERKRAFDFLTKLPGITVYPSETNFLLVHFEQAAELLAHLEEQKIGVRSFISKPGLENCLRITIGTREENDRWLQAVERFVKGA